MMLALIVAAVGYSRGLTQDETVTLSQTMQGILTKRGLDPTTLTIKQAYSLLNFAVEAVIEQSRGSASGAPLDPNSPPAIG